MHRSGLIPTALILTVGAVTVQAQMTQKTVLEGVYTETQANRGAAAYHDNCAHCHEGADVDGPPLTGDFFVDRWREDTLSSLFDFIRNNMPQDKPGRLEETTYRDITAYLLQANLYPSGDQELTAESIRNVLLVGKNGPQPLPTNALVRVVGCLALTADGAWLLSNATDPSRTRVAEHSAPEELQASAARPLGKQTFRLQNLDELTEFRGNAFKGHKIQVKGVLIRQTNGDRINVASLNNLGDKCGQ